MVEVNRRSFLVGTGLVTAGVACGAEVEKQLDGDFAPVSEPGIPERKLPLVPPGAHSLANFTQKCVGCQLCVQACPNHVLRPSKDPKRLMQPEMGFEKGYCRPECTKCGEVCPAGAITPVTVEQKRHTHLGHAIWHKDRCLVTTKGVACDACAHHCPEKALVMIPLNENDPKSLKVPVLDKMRCIACGACEHLCPARPAPGMTVKGFEQHREVKPMGDANVLAEARRLFEAKRAAVMVVKEGVFVASGNGRGLGPFLQLVDTRAAELKGAWVIDKVIGKAAAALCITAGVQRVHAELMGEAAVKLLDAHKIPHTQTKVVPQILNREQTGMCPLEETVKDLNDLPAMVKAIRVKLAALRAAPPKH